MVNRKESGDASTLSTESFDSRDSAVQEVFEAMRGHIAQVFPEDDQEAWSWQAEDFSRHAITPPVSDFDEWLRTRYEGSDDFSKRMVRRMFAMWSEMESDGFSANDKILYEHQKALFAWIALSTVTGTRDRIANLLVRSPYGSGKSLVAGLTVRAFTEAQEEMIAEGAEPKSIPTGALLGLRKEHMLQNAMGAQYAVLQPPYAFDRTHSTAFWKNLSVLFGKDFSECFEKPKGKKHPFHDIFGISDSDDETELPAATQRVSACVKAFDAARAKRWSAVSADRKKQILSTLSALAEGKIVLIPDVYNVPQIEKAPVRQDDLMEEGARYRGDSAHALHEREGYRVKATHKHLALDPNEHTTKPNTEDPAQFCIAYGSMLMRDPDLIRADIREEIMKRGVFMAIDEAGKFTPVSLGDSMAQLSGKWPFIAGFTGYDAGIEGWTARSPMLSTRKMVELGLMKPIAFAGIGDPHAPPKAGTEEAWAAYRDSMFAAERTAETLGQPQPYECDTVVVAPPANLREYAHRIKREHERKNIPLKIWCFDPDSGETRWDIVVNGFNAPKGKGEPRRILVAPPAQIAEALTLRAECYDVLTPVNRYTADQIRGRLGHVRNNEGTADQKSKARTYLRMQWLQNAPGEVYVREVAKMMGYEYDDENASVIPLGCIIDAVARERDAHRKNLSSPAAIPDSAPVRKRKNKRKPKSDGTPLGVTSRFVIEKERLRAERAAAKELRRHLADGGTAESFRQFQDRPMLGIMPAKPVEPVRSGSPLPANTVPVKQEAPRPVGQRFSVIRVLNAASVESTETDTHSLTIDGDAFVHETEPDEDLELEAEVEDRIDKKGKKNKAAQSVKGAADKPAAKKKAPPKPKPIEIKADVVIDDAGRVLNFEALLAQFAISPSYHNSASARISGCRQSGKRGQELAEAVLDNLLAVAETQARRAGWKPGDSSRYIGVKVSG